MTNEYLDHTLEIAKGFIQILDKYDTNELMIISAELDARSHGSKDDVAIVKRIDNEVVRRAHFSVDQKPISNDVNPLARITD